jgi:hypothetical protein
MRYWNDMQTKFGFSDGEAVPDGVGIYRAIYIRAVNRLAEQLGSKVRATAYDRAGMHNWCLILFYDTNDLVGLAIDELVQPLDLSAKGRDEDEGMHEAIRQAYLLELDNFVEVTVHLSTDFDEFVMTLEPTNEDTP